MRASAPTWLYPFQGAFFPDPDVADDQNEEEDQHFDQSEYAQRFELHRPREQENSLHIEDDEQDGHDVVPNRIAATGAVYRINAAFIGHQFGLAGIVGAHQLGCQQGHGYQDSYKRYEDEYGNVILRHRSPLANLLAEA